jgi:hypothetical protein
MGMAGNPPAGGIETHQVVPSMKTATSVMAMMPAMAAKKAIRACLNLAMCGAPAGPVSSRIFSQFHQPRCH